MLKKYERNFLQEVPLVLSSRIFIKDFVRRNCARQGKASERSEAVVAYGDLSESQLWGSIVQSIRQNQIFL